MKATALYSKQFILIAFCSAIIMLSVISQSLAQTSGISESSLILNINNGGNVFYDLQAATVNADFDGLNLGTFNSTQSINLSGAQQKTSKCGGCNISGSTLYYRVYEIYSIPASFNGINIPLSTNDTGGCGGNQTWRLISNTANILSGLNSGVYYLEVYTTAGYSNCGTGTNTANNGGLNYKATFKVDGIIVQYAGVSTSSTITATATSNSGVTISNGTITNFCTTPLNIMRTSAGAFNQSTATNYIEFKVKPQAGYQFTVSAIKIDSRKAGGGPKYGRIDYNANNTGFVTGVSYQTSVTTISCTSTVPQQASFLSGVSITDTVNGLTVRVYYWSNLNATGMLDYSSLSVEGIVSEISSTPKLSLPTAINLSTNSATLGATLVSNSGSAVTARGTVYKTSPGVTSSDNQLAEGGTSPGAFSHSRTSLNSQTLYYYAGYATNSFGTSLSTESSFRTRSKVPLNQAAGLTATTVTFSSVDLNWIGAVFPTTGATKYGYLVLYSTGTPAIVSAPGGLPPSSVVANGTIVNTIDATNPAQPAATATATGLNGNTVYNFLVVPYTWNGVNTNTYSYLITGAPSATATTFPANYLWTGTGTGSWTTASNWQPNGVPTNQDAVTFNNTGTINVTNVPDVSLTSLSVSGVSDVTLSPPATGGNNSITLYNTGTALNITQAAALQISGGGSNSLTIQFSGTGNNAIINGKLSLLKITGSAGNYHATNSNTVVNGVLVKESSASIVSSPGNLTFNAGSKFQLTGNGLVIPTATWNTGSTCELAVTLGGTITGMAQVFSNFKVNCPALTSPIQCNGALTIINDTFNLANTNYAAGKTFALTATTPYILNLNGDLIINDNACLDITNGTPVTTGVATINLKKNLTITGTGLLNQSGSAEAFFNFIKPTGEQVVTLANSNSISQADFSATINIGNGNTVNTLKMNSDISLGAFFISNVLVNNGAALDFGNYVLSGLGGNINALAGSTLRIGNANGINATALSGNVQLSGDRIFSPAAIYTYSGNVSQVTGDALPVSVNSIIIDNTGPTGNNTVSLSNNDSATALTLSNGLFNPNGKLLAIKQNGSLNGRGGNFSSTSTGTVAFTNGFASGALDFYPLVQIKGAVDFGTNSTIYSALQIDNGGYIVVNPPAYENGSILKYNSGTTYSRGLEWSAGNGVGYPCNVQIRNNTNLDLSANGWNNRMCSGYLNIASGCSLTMGSMTNSLTVNKQVVLDGMLALATGANGGGDIHVGGNWTRNTTGLFIPNSRIVFLEGTSSSNINGTATDASFDYLVINKTTGASVTINKDVTIQKELTFTSGNINTTNFKVIIPQSGSVVRTSGHVNGNLQKYIVTGSALTYLYEVGDDNFYAPVSPRFATVNTAGNFMISTKAGDHPNIASTIFDGAKTINRYWTITNAGVGFTTYSPTFYFDPADVDAGVISDSVFCGRYENGNWVYPNMGTKTSTSARILSMSGLGDFQLGVRCTSPVLSASVNNVSCRNGNNGVVVLSATAGSPPFNYSWSNSATTKDISNCISGTYTVTVTGQGGCSSTSSVTINQPATAISISTSSNTPVCAGSTLNLTGGATGGTGTLNYAWTGPNNFGSTLANPLVSNVSASAGGSYQVSVTDANSCVASKSTSVVINTVTPAITGSTSFCAGSSSLLSAGSYSSYLWSNGVTVSSISVATSNTYTVTVTAANGCSGTTSIITTAIPVLTPTIGIASNMGNTICAGTTVTFTATITNGGSTPVYKWKKNGVIVGSNSPIYTDAGLITGDIIKCALSCPCATINPVASSSITMNVSQPITVVAGTGPLAICSTGAATVFGTINNTITGYTGTWSTSSGAGTFSNAAWNGVNGVTYTADVNDAGKTIYLVLTGPVSGSCAGRKDSLAVDVRSGVSITTGTVTAVCKGTSSFSIPYSSTTGSPVEYTLMAGAPNPMPGFVNQISQSLTPNLITAALPAGTQAGIYNFTLQVANSPCQSVLYNLQLTINPNPVVTISSSLPAICQGGSTTLTASGASGFNWMPGMLDGSVVSVAPSATTAYTVIGTSAFGCSSTSTISIAVNPLPVPVISGSSSICYGSNTILNAGSGYNSYSWSNGSTSQNITVSNANAYTVTVTNANNCSASVSKQLSVLPQIVVTATANADSIQAGDTVLLSSNATGSVSGITYSVTSTTFAPLSGTATKVSLGDDQMSAALPIGFNFVFYGNAYNNFYISSNGFITFNAGSNDGCCQGPPIPNNGNGNVSNMISLAWNDLTGAGGTVDYFTTGTVPNRKLVVRYNIFHINGDPVVAQAILFEGTNNIEIHATTIPDMTSVDASYISTMGVENDGGTVASTVPGRNGTGWAATNDAWKFVPSASYNYTWNPPAGLSNANIKNPVAIPLTPTTYTVTATAYNGCTGTASKFIYVNQPSTLTAFSSATIINCNGSTSIVIVSALGGIPPYSGIGTFTVNAGTYTYTVTDAIGQSTSTNITITQPALLSVSTSATVIACNGGSSLLTVSATGGTPPYSGTGTFTVGAGTYTYTVTDSKGCTSSSTVIVNQPNVLEVNSSATLINCYGMPSLVTVSATGGTTPYIGTGNYSVGAGTYTYTVTDAKGCSSSTTVTINQPPVFEANSYGYTTVCYHDSTTITVIASGGTPPYTGTGNYKVAAGTYTYTVTDSKGCTSTTAITVTELPQLISTVSLLQNVSCYGKTDGKITVAGSNGSSPYLYLWNDGTTNKSLASLAAGTYTVSITDNNGCSIGVSYTVTQPNDIVISGNQSNISCNGGSNGAISISVTGGTTPYSYLWVNGNTTTSINLLSAANYKVTVTDGNGCNATNTFSLTQPVVFSSTGSGTNVNCFGANTGAASISVSGGTAPYNYFWSTGANTTSLNNITANDYTVTVTDANGCTVIRNYTITENPQLLLATAPQNLNCYGDNDGKATASPTGGTTFYSYLWNTGATTKTANGLTAGTYTVTVTDTKGCTVTGICTLTQPSLLTVGGNSTNISCNGYSTGTISVTSTGGAGSNMYSWNNGSTTTSLSGLTSGNYTITVTDANACRANASFTISQPTALATTLTNSNISCNGAANGSASITATGGTSPYAYQWSTGSTNLSLSSLTPATYTVTVTDSKGCTGSKSAVISQPATLANSITVVDVACNGNTNGSVTSNPTGGTAPYSYLWDSGLTTKAQSSIGAATYTVTVTDSRGCTKSAIAVVNQPPAIVNTATSNNVTCFGSNNGTISVTPSGGVTPYSYLWTSGSTQANLTGLSPNSYTVTITDNSGCTKLKTITITEPVQLVLSNSVTNLTCYGAGDGKVTANPTGGTNPYDYLWSNNAITKTANSLAAGTYTVTVTDSKGCTKTASSIATQPNDLVVNTTVNNVNCNGGSSGSITNVVTGGTTPFTYSWNSGSTTLSRSGLSSGNYTVTVTDANGCTNKVTSTVTQPAILSVTGTGYNITCYGSGNGNASGASSGGTLPYSYLWNNSSTSSSINNLLQGTYTVTVTDNKGCSATKSYSISQPAVLGLSIAATNSTCNGANNGIATANPTGGNTPYSYLWNGGTATKTFSNMAPGNYTVTVTDGKGCNTTLSAAITEPAVLAYATNLLKNVSCNGGNNGKIDLTITGGTSPYDYLWNNGATTKVITTLTAGLYTITTTDNKGCTKTSSYSVTAPAVLTVSINKTNPTIGGGNNGSATANPSGGTSPYTYSWATAPVKTSSTISSVGAGNYVVTVTDFNGCTQTNSVILVASRFAGNLPDNDDLSIKVMPNPNNGTFVLQVSSIAGGLANVQLMDATSRMVYSENIELNNGSNEKLINTNGVAEGIYVLKVTTINKSQVIQLIVQ